MALPLDESKFLLIIALNEDSIEKAKKCYCVKAETKDISFSMLQGIYNARTLFDVSVPRSLSVDHVLRCLYYGNLAHKPI